MISHLCLTLCIPMDCSLPGFSVHGFPLQEYWMPCPPPGDLPDPGIKPASLKVSCIGRWILYHYHHLESRCSISFFFFFLTNIRFKELLLMLISLYMFPCGSKWAFLVYFQEWNCVLEQGSPAPEPLTGRLGTGPHSRRWAADEWEKLCLYSQPLPSALRSSQTPAQPWKNCFPWNLSLVPKRY